MFKPKLDISATYYLGRAHFNHTPAMAHLQL